MINKRKYIIIISGSFALLALLAYAAFQLNNQKNNILNPQLSKPESVIRDRWLSSVKCSPPCWEGIEPGQPASKALEILKDNELVTNITINNDKNTNIGEIAWNWTVNPKSGGRLFFYLKNDALSGDVYAILPEIGCCEDLEKIILAFGKPGYVLVLKTNFMELSPPQEIISSYALVWPGKGFLIKGFPAHDTKIDNKFQVDTVVFFYPSWKGFLDFQGNSGVNAIPWHGYDDGINYLKP